MNLVIPQNQFQSPYIELRSDTFTRPGPGMLEAMLEARVGDDVFGEDAPTKTLEQTCASFFGFEEGLFCVSGTMANQIAIMVHTKPGDEVICDALSHIYLYEGGGIAANAGASVSLLQGDLGRLNARQISEAIQPDNDHYPKTRLVSLENTVNKGGGSIYSDSTLEEIHQLCRNRDLRFHLDGARLWNALIETGQSPSLFSQRFDSISVCLSKGMGSPMGSVLIGNKAFITEARRTRKRIGGGWRQSGFMAAAGLFALQNNFFRLKEDHHRARVLSDCLLGQPYVFEVLPVQTNIVLFTLHSGLKSTDFVSAMKELGVLCAVFGPDKVRMVTHLDFSDKDLELTCSALRKISFSGQK
jgi:threonine aldolase